MRDEILFLKLGVDNNKKPLKPEFELMKNDLDNIRAYIGGNIEAINIGDIVVLLNEDGKIMDLPLNRILLDKCGGVIDGLVGNILCCRADANGNFCSIERSDLDIVEKYMIAVFGNEVLTWD